MSETWYLARSKENLVFTFREALQGVQTKGRLPDYLTGAERKRLFTTGIVIFSRNGRTVKYDLSPYTLAVLADLESHEAFGL